MNALKKTSFLGMIGGFFPVQILFGHLKYNLISLFYWVFLFSIVSENFGRSFGIPYLFFSPEYLGEVSGLSFGLLGFSIGGFTMGFHTYSYIKLGPRYPFLATVSRPFFKFCLNNSLLPIFFVCYYLIRMMIFQLNEELSSFTTVLWYSLTFCIGFISFIVLSIFYFFPTTKEKNVKIPQDETSENPIQSMTQGKEKWYDYFRTEKERTYYYVGRRLSMNQSRSTKHLDKQIIERVFATNRINASIFEILTILSFIISGQFIDYSAFEFPAAMSIVLLLTIVHMLFSAMMSWFHRWTYPILIGIILIMNYLSVNSNYFSYKNFAYGLSYSEDHIQKKYNVGEIEKIHTSSNVEISSKENMIAILENWKRNTGEEKPKMVILNTSGGGSRSALWTFTVLQRCDQALYSELSDHICLISGASGGMVGAAYYREILLRSKLDPNFKRFDLKYHINLGKDLLNKLAFSASTNDLFFRYQTFNYKGHEYTKDRGYAWEEHLHENSENILQHNLGYYESYEQKALIPLMIFSPTIVNDGRRLLISSQNLSFITDNPNYPKVLAKSYENVDYQTFFEDNNPQDIRFSTCLRASSTFPFIMPMVSLPTSPGMQLMDAGIRDNYGSKASVEYLFALQDWIKENTSGVIILEIRDTKRNLNKESFEAVSLIKKLTLPFGNMYNNFPRTQDFDQEELLKLATTGLPFNVEVITFNLRESQKDKISLSWHLTKKEKFRISEAVNSQSNQESFKNLKALLSTLP